MRVEVHRETKVGMVLDEDEARWLMGAMQNPLSKYPEDEDPKDREMRERFFTAIRAKLGR